MYAFEGRGINVGFMLFHRGRREFYGGSRLSGLLVETDLQLTSTLGSKLKRLCPLFAEVGIAYHGPSTFFHLHVHIQRSFITERIDLGVLLDVLVVIVHHTTAVCRCLSLLKIVGVQVLDGSNTRKVLCYRVDLLRSLVHCRLVHTDRTITVATAVDGFTIQHTLHQGSPMIEIVVFALEFLQA